MRFYRVVVVNKSDKTGVPLLTAAEALFVMPHLHDGADHPLGFTVGLWVVDTGELLSDAKALQAFTNS